MYNKTLKILTLALSTALISGCGGGSSSDNEEEISSDINLQIRNDYESIPLESASYHINIQTDHTTNLYLVLTNTNPIDTKDVIINHNAKSINKSYKQLNNGSKTKDIKNIVPKFITQFNNNIDLSTTKSASKNNKQLIVDKTNKVVGDSYTFIVEDDMGNAQYTDTTLRSKVTVDTKFGTKTLLVWVSNDSFEDSCTKQKCITQDMVEELQEEFLKDGYDNDIYDWVTNIYGEEWGEEAHEKYVNLIPEDNEINILFTDLGEDDNPYGGVMGYFYSKDNFEKTQYPNSNEMIMFYVDSVMFANDEYDGFWQKEMYSTLAHEFQHMIHFYQKRVLLDAQDDTWINEMLSETTEDLIATKIDHIGPRGVDPTDGSSGDYDNTNGRYPLFNQYNDISLTEWRNSLENYSNVNAFGAFLTRNYGGAKVLHDILYNTKEHEDTVEYATGENFGDLLQQWGEAVLLSSIENPYGLPTYNFGDFKDVSYGNVTYNLGSIDFFKYAPTPKLYSIDDGNNINIQPHSNKYYLIGQELDGTIDLNISIPTGTKAILISK